MKQIDICPQPIFSFTATSELLKEAQNIAHGEEYAPNGNRTNQTSSNVFLNKDPRCTSLVSWFESCVNQVKFKYEYQCDKLSITQMWINKSTFNQWHHGHTHPYSVLSGIFYLTESDSTTWLSIQDHWTKDMVDGSLPLNRGDELKCLIHKEPSAPGKLILFPSHLYHSVNEHTLIEPRYTISFNTFPTGNVGRMSLLSGMYIPNI